MELHGEWGKDGENGGEVTLNAKNQQLDGNIEVDNISSAEINLNENSSLKGTINGENTAKSITLNMDSNSSFTLTGDTYITTLNNSDKTNSNINFNGYKLFVNGEEIK